MTNVLFRFRFKELTAINQHGFSVFDTHGNQRRASDFLWDGQAIQITLHTGNTLRVTFGVNDAGECKFKFGDAELETWQVARRALEGLMF